MLVFPLWLMSVKKHVLASALFLLYTVCGSSLAMSTEVVPETFEPAKLSVLVSVRPLALIAEAVVGDHADVEVLVAAGQSPHHYSLKASDRQRIAVADLVLWVGPELERFLVRPLRAAKYAMTASVTPGVDSVRAVSTGTEHHHGSSSHPWLAPEMAMLLAQRLATQLGLLDPDSADAFQANADALAARIKQLDDAIKASLAGSDKPYAVAHDAYRSFSEHYGLPEPIVLSVSPEVSPGARKLWQLQSQFAPQSCVLVELEHQSRWLKALVETQHLRLHTVDTLAYNPKITRYTDFLTDISKTFKACLQ